MKTEIEKLKCPESSEAENRLILVCFAVKEEAAAFVRSVKARPEVAILLTGMGRRNAEKAFRSALATARPGLVLTCGFAGGLKPEWPTGTVVFETEPEAACAATLREAGAVAGHFLCVDQVAATAEQKRLLRQQTGADAVEMESSVIRALCREKAIPSATVRVILDTAEEDLALDFNAVMTAEQKIDPVKLALALARSPSRISGLLRLQKQSRAAAQKLDRVLSALVAA